MTSKKKPRWRLYCEYTIMGSRFTIQEALTAELPMYRALVDGEQIGEECESCQGAEILILNFLEFTYPEAHKCHQSG